MKKLRQKKDSLKKRICAVPCFRYWTILCSKMSAFPQWQCFPDFSSKRCFENATWEAQTDYSTCSITPRLLRRYRFHIAMLSFSIASSLPAVIIFFVYKRLRITRVALHRNLLIAIIIRNVLVIVSRSEVSLIFVVLSKF